MNILVTGGTGFIGSRLALRCLAEGHGVRILGLENTSAEALARQQLKEAGAEMVIGSVTKPETLAGLAAGIDVVFHLAAAQHEMGVPDRHFEEVNVEGTRNVLAESSREGVGRFVYGSTIGVYGDPKEAVDELSACRPDNVYGRTKLAAEQIALADADGLPVVIVRISETYGPGDHRLLKLFRAVAKGRFPIIGSGRNRHHPIFIEDLVDGLLASIDAPKATGEVLLLPGAEAVTTRQMVEGVAEALHASAPRLRLPLAAFFPLAIGMETCLRPLGIDPPLHRRRLDFFRKSFQISSRKAEELLGFKARFGFPEGARLTAKWYKDLGYL